MNHDDNEPRAVLSPVLDPAPVLGRCIHFNGLQHDRCKAGVLVLSVRDISPPRPYRWPCITFVGAPPCATTCASFRAETQEERDARTASTLAAAEQHCRKLAHGHCPTCNTLIGEFRQEGCCVYAEPCGHRIGQGNAARMEASVAGRHLGEVSQVGE